MVHCADVETEEAARASVLDDAELMVVRFERQADDAYGSPCSPLAA
jgi:hypothetical protein